jgi:hypothetical protein
VGPAQGGPLFPRADVARHPRGDRLKSPLRRNTGKSGKLRRVDEISRDQLPHAGHKNH